VGAPRKMATAADRRSSLETGNAGKRQRVAYRTTLPSGARTLFASPTERTKFGFFDECLAVYCDLEHDTRVTRKVPGEVDRQRLIVFDRIEQTLAERKELTTARLQAINDARHELARKYWQENRELKNSILYRIRRSDANYVPDPGPDSPFTYIAVYRLFGFDAAQMIAALRRRLLSGSRQAHA
jgi:hypothetical protein